MKTISNIYSKTKRVEKKKKKKKLAENLFSSN